MTDEHVPADVRSSYAGAAGGLLLQFFVVVVLLSALAGMGGAILRDACSQGCPW